MTHDANDLLTNIDKLHTTDLGLTRISRNIGLQNVDVVTWCKNQIHSKLSIISRKGKNWYIAIDNCVITVNAYSFTIITAHKN